MESYKVILPIGPFSAQKKKKSGVLRLKLSRVHTYCHLGRLYPISHSQDETEYELSQAVYPQSCRLSHHLPEREGKT